MPTIIKFSSYLFGSFFGVLAFLQLEINIVVSNYFLIDCINIGILLLTFILTCTLMVYIQLTQAEKILKKCLKCLLWKDASNSNLRHLSNAKINCELHKFFHFHTSCLIEVCGINKMFGHFLLQFLVLNSPVNAFMICSLLYGQVQYSQLSFVLTVIWVQLFGNFVIHWLAILASLQIHKSTKVLLSLYLKLFRHNDKYFSNLRLQLKLYCYICKFLTRKNKYGITYGALGHLVTFKSFTRVSNVF